MNDTLTQTPAETATEVVVSVDHLRVRYGDTLAVDDVSLSIERGEIFGILGPNGAGKTTTVECIGGLRKPDAGSISVLGLDLRGDRRRAARARRHPAADLGAPGQDLRARGARAVRLVLQRSAPSPTAARSCSASRTSATTRYVNLSGGQRQRLSIALALSAARSWRSSTS